MTKNIQIIGFALILIGAVLIALSMTMGWNNNNAISFGSVGMVISGLITYVIAGKKALSENIKKN
ncbi:MAG: hypothetical protein IIW77_02960 [Bacteroidaceae bacterium]|nr:hypothetical protein [Bacteroidaceae bacterium]